VKIHQRILVRTFYKTTKWENISNFYGNNSSYDLNSSTLFLHGGSGRNHFQGARSHSTPKDKGI
jgi:hypothetical protein